MTKSNNKLYSTQYLKSWSANAERETFLTDESVLENSYSLNDEVDDEMYTQGVGTDLGTEENSWIDLNQYSTMSRTQNDVVNDGPTQIVSHTNLIDDSLTTILLGSDTRRRRSSNTTNTSITMIGGGLPAENEKFGTIPEYKSRCSSASSLPSELSDHSTGVNSPKNARKKKKGKQDKDVKVINVLFQITCLSVIIASFSFSLGFIFGAKNFNNRAQNAWVF